ncbi:MAG: hypothetical protein JW801_07340 [Bacteroidales bacterium]|nr:hypothetical protein [Bacteroidales bacterium]
MIKEQTLETLYTIHLISGKSDKQILLTLSPGKSNCLDYFVLTTYLLDDLDAD